MRLLIVVLCLLSERYLIHSISYQRFFWFKSYCLVIEKTVKKSNPTPNGWLLLTAIIMPVTLAVYVVYWLFSAISFGLFGYVISLGLFFYCLGPQNVFYPLTHASSVESHDKQVSNYLVNANSHLFAVIFWYMIAGPIVVLIYRLITLAKTIPAVSSEACEIADIMEWLPARMTVLLYLLAGNFQRGFALFCQFLLSPIRANNEMISQCGLLAVRVNATDDLPLLLAENLVERALIILLVFIALLTLIWF